MRRWKIIWERRLLGFSQVRTTVVKADTEYYARLKPEIWLGFHKIIHIEEVKS